MGFDINKVELATVDVGWWKASGQLVGNKLKVGESLGDRTEYWRQAKRNQRENAKQDVKKNTSVKIEFIGKRINIKKFESVYKDKVKDDAVKYFLYKSILDIVPLIGACKDYIEKEGAFIKGTTGTIKANPAQKELRENTKAFTTLLEQLNSMLGKDDKPDISSWLDDDDEDE